MSGPGWSHAYDRAGSPEHAGHRRQTAILPRGTVTFLFTDIEGSTALAREMGERYPELLAAHNAVLRQAFSRGTEVGTEGDSFFVAFESATAAVSGAVDAQRRLADYPWPEGRQCRVRMGMHTGQADVVGADYVGYDVHRASRVGGAGHGGQVLLTEATATLVSRELPEGVTLRDLGVHRLRDIAVPERIFQLVITGIDAAFPALRTLGDERSNLPVQLTPFIGRAGELEELRALARDHRMVTLIGTGGTGKTRMMLEAAGGLAPEYADGARWVELAPISDPEHVLLAVARGLGVREEPGRSLADTVTDFLRGKSLLLLLDNCEHLLSAVAELVEGVIATAPGVSVLASSREALGVSGERVFQVPSMRVPAPPALDELHHGEAAAAWLAEARASDAFRLFVDRATAVMPSFTLISADEMAVAEICRRLDGIPLAIELAAARVPVLSVQEIADRLHDRFRLLTGGRRTALPRQQTLQALIDWSWDLLGENERRLLRRLSVFTGGATLDAISTVAGDSVRGEDGASAPDTLETLGRLVARSLVVVDRSGTTRYRLLETIRQYALDRLVAAGEMPEVRTRHVAFYLDLALRAEPELTRAAMVDWLAILDVETDNLRTAVEWGLEADPLAAIRLCLALAIYWRSRSLVEGFERLRDAAELGLSLAASTSVGAEDRLPVARVLAAAANASWMAGSAAVGRPWADESLRLAREIGDPQALAEALNAVAMTTMFTGEFDGVNERTAESMRLAESVGMWSMIGFAQAGLAQWEVERGDHAAAAQRLEAARAAAKRSGSPEVIAFAALSRGRVEGFRRRLPEARRAFAEAIAGYERIADSSLALVARSDLAHALRLNGAADEAAELYRETLHAWQHAGNRGAIANQLESTAFLALARGNHADAARLLGAAESIREEARAPMLAFERGEHAAALAGLRTHLDSATLDSIWAEGRALTSEEAIGLAMAVL